MDTIPSWFWMVIIAGITGMVGLILFYVAMLLKESMLTVREFRYMMVEMHDIIDTVKVATEKLKNIMDMIESSVKMIKTAILKPIASIGSIFERIREFFTRFTGGGESEEATSK